MGENRLWWPTIYDNMTVKTEVDLIPGMDTSKKF